MINVTPCGHRVLVKQDSLKERDATFKRAIAAGLALPEHTEIRREQLSVDTGVVLKVGPTAFKDYGGDPWCKVGDRVAFAKHTGKVFRDPKDKEVLYLVQNDEDIIAVIGDDHE
jgi:co-chaperonin GroES (HSP10)